VHHFIKSDNRYFQPDEPEHGEELLNIKEFDEESKKQEPGDDKPSKEKLAYYFSRKVVSHINSREHDPIITFSEDEWDTIGFRADKGELTRTSLVKMGTSYYKPLGRIHSMEEAFDVKIVSSLEAAKQISKECCMEEKNLTMDALKKNFTGDSREVEPVSFVRKGGRMWWLALYDVFAVLLCEIFFGDVRNSVAALFVVENTQTWWFRYVKMYYANTFYAFLMLPFLVLRVPVLHGLITRKAIPTGYSNSGFIGAMLSPAQIDKLKKEREQRDSQETRQERSATIKGDQDSECCWGIARCPRHIEKSDYGLMINEDELIRSKTSQVAGSLAHSSSEAAEAVFDVLTACASASFKTTYGAAKLGAGILALPMAAVQDMQRAASHSAAALKIQERLRLRSRSVRSKIRTMTASSSVSGSDRFTDYPAYPSSP